MASTIEQIAVRKAKLREQRDAATRKIRIEESKEHVLERKALRARHLAWGKVLDELGFFTLEDAALQAVLNRAAKTVQKTHVAVEETSHE